MLKKKKILITSGGTREYIDDVRVMTNISSGALGAKIADHLHSKGAEIVYVHGAGSVLPKRKNRPNLTCLEASTADEVLKLMQSLIGIKMIDAVIHCMAVSDFTFKRTDPVKLKSNSPEDFIEYMRVNIQKNPKIISQIKEWDPNVILVGFKFEVGVPHETLIELAYNSIRTNKCDMVLANDKVEMIEEGVHVGHLVFSEDLVGRGGLSNITACGKDEIAEVIGTALNMLLKKK